jgi:hypothetical protein
MDTQITTPNALQIPPSGIEQLDQKHRELIEQHQTQYVFVPLIDAACPAIPGGNVPSCKIVPIQAAEQRQQLWKFGTDRPHRIEGELKNIGVYLCPPAPIVAGLLVEHTQYGAIKVKALAGMSAKQFEALDLNRKLFGDPLPRTAKGIRESLGRFAGTNDPVVSAIITEVLASVKACENFCHQWIDRRHRVMDDPNDQEPKRYSTLDQRCLQFADIVPRDQMMADVVRNQTSAIAALPGLIERIERRDAESEKRWESLIAGMTGAFNNQAEAMKAIVAGKVGVDSSANGEQGKKK